MDLISRRAAIEEIARRDTTDGTVKVYSGREICDILNALPTAEIVRCKDCKWFGQIGCAIGVVDDTDKPTENDYCSFAERRSDG